MEGSGCRSDLRGDWLDGESASEAMRRISTSPLTASSTRASESFRKSWWIRNGGAERNGQRGNGGSTYRPIFARETENITFTSAAGHSNARIRSPDGKGTILRARARSLRSGFRSKKWAL